MANRLTIRDQQGNVIAEPWVGSPAVLWRPETGTIRSMTSTSLQGWIGSQLEELASQGGDQDAFLDQTVSVADEGKY